MEYKNFLKQIFNFLLRFGKVSWMTGVRRRVRGGLNPPPRTGRNCCRKMLLFPKALFLATTFPKNRKIQFFYWIFIKNFEKFLTIFPTICVFRQKREKVMHGLLNFSKNAKIMDFRNFLQKFFENSQNFPRICVFRPNARKITPCFVKFFEKYAKIKEFS